MFTFFFAICNTFSQCNEPRIEYLNVLQCKTLLTLVYLNSGLKTPHYSQYSVNAPSKADEHILALSNRHQVDFFSLCSLANVEVQS